MRDCDLVLSKVLIWKCNMRQIEYMRWVEKERQTERNVTWLKMRWKMWQSSNQNIEVKKADEEDLDQALCLDFDLNGKSPNCSSIIITGIINSKSESMYLCVRVFTCACIERNNAPSQFKWNANIIVMHAHGVDVEQSWPCIQRIQQQIHVYRQILDDPHIIFNVYRHSITNTPNWKSNY